MGKEIKEYELVVSQGNRPLWSRIIAAILFTMMLCGICWICMLYFSDDPDNNAMKDIPRTIKAISYCLVGGISFSVTKTILIDTNNDILISRFCVGPFYKDVKSDVPQLEYVSVFLDGKERYQVNLWYIGNKHYQMYFFEDKKAAMKFGQEVAQKLSIDLLDATEKGNSIWIDLPKT